MRQLRDFVSCARKGARKAAHENWWPTKTRNATVLHSENRCTTVYQLPSDCVIGWDTKMTSLPNSNASFTNNRDRQIWRDRQNWRLHPTVWAFTAWTEDRVLAWFCWYQTSIIIHRSFTGPSSSFVSQCPRTGKFRGVWAGRKSWQNRHVQAEAELRAQQGFRGWAQIRSRAETTDHSRKLASAIVCRWRRSGHVTRSSAWSIPHILLK